MNPRAVRALYNIALPAALTAALPGSLVKMRRRGGHSRDFGQRFGLYRPDIQGRLAALTKPWWIHAVSVGEVLVATKLIAAIRRLAPAVEVVLSTTTSTGRAVAVRELPPDAIVLYNPVDLPGAVRRALDAIRPGHLILVEAEVWPNLVHAAHDWGLPVSLVNARLSSRSERRFRAVRPLVAPVFGALDLVCLPDPEDVVRWGSIGVRPDAMIVTGSLKYDYESVEPSQRTVDFASHLATLWGSTHPPILLAASTHAGEEVALAQVFMGLREEFPALRLLVVPRHVERSTQIAADLMALGLRVSRRSQPQPAEAPDVHLIDTTGELRDWQPLADAVVVGKSFLSKGGQNPVEALMAGRPVVVGPHMENFAPLMRSLLDHQAICQVSSLSGLALVLADLLRSSDRSRQLSLNARAALAPHQGSARRTAEILLSRQTAP